MAPLVWNGSCLHMASPRSQASWGHQHLLKGLKNRVPWSSSPLVTGVRGHHTVYPSGHLRVPGPPVCRPLAWKPPPAAYAPCFPSKLPSSLGCGRRPARAPRVSDPPHCTMWPLHPSTGPGVGQSQWVGAGTPGLCSLASAGARGEASGEAPGGWQSLLRGRGQVQS